MIGKRGLPVLRTSEEGLVGVVVILVISDGEQGLVKVQKGLLNDFDALSLTT